MSRDQLHSLVRALASTSPETRAEAIRLAADVVPPELLVGVITSEVPVALRSGAMDALRFIGTPALPAILRGAGQPDHGSIFCLQLLAWFDDEEGLSLLCRAAATDTPLRQQAAIEALGFRADPRAVDVIVQALRSGEPWVSMAAVVALGRIADPRALEALRQVVSDPWVGASATDLLVRAEAKAAEEVR